MRAYPHNLKTRAWQDFLFCHYVLNETRFAKGRTMNMLRYFDPLGTTAAQLVSVRRDTRTKDCVRCPLDEIKQMTQWRWNRTLKCKIIHVD